jgi:hypothetical protein
MCVCGGGSCSKYIRPVGRLRWGPWASLAAAGPPAAHSSPPCPCRSAAGCSTAAVPGCILSVHRCTHSATVGAHVPRAAAWRAAAAHSPQRPAAGRVAGQGRPRVRAPGTYRARTAATAGRGAATPPGVPHPHGVGVRRVVPRGRGTRTWRRSSRRMSRRGAFAAILFHGREEQGGRGQGPTEALLSAARACQPVLGPPAGLVRA